MTFKKIVIENFLSFGPEKQTLDLSQPGLYLVIGKNDITGDSNGSGKSSLFDAICFALFGKVSKDIKVEKYVNEITGKNTRVEIQFELNKKNYWIIRHRRHDEHKENILVYEAKKDKKHLISKANKADTQEIIDNLIKFNYKSFMSAVMMSQENIDGFLNTDTNKKKEIIENILQLNVISKYYWISQQKRKQKKNIVEKLQLKLDNSQQLIENTKQSMVEYVSSCKAKKSEAKDKISKLQEKLKELEELNIEEQYDKIRKAEEISANIDQLTVNQQRHQDNIKSLKKTKDGYESSLLEYKGLIETNNNLIKQIKKEIDRLEQRIEELEKQIEEAETNPESCPVCKNEINKEKFQIWLNENTEKQEHYQSDKIEKDKRFKEMEEKISDWEKKVEELNIAMDEVDTSIDKEKEQYSLIEKDIKELRDSIPKTESFETLQKISENISNIKQEIRTLENSDFVDKNYLDSLTESVKKHMKENKDIQSKLDEEKKKLVLFRWWEDSLSHKKYSLKSWCINNVIGYFNARIKHYIDRFFDGDVQIQMDSDLNEVIYTKDRDRDFGQYSGGEKRRLNLAILFALYSLARANISTKINIMFLDEILSTSLDDKGISTVLDLLDEMKNNNDTVFVIDHKENFKDYPSFNPILINKGNDEFSRIKLLYE